MSLSEERFGPKSPVRTSTAFASRSQFPFTLLAPPAIKSSFIVSGSHLAQQSPRLFALHCGTFVNPAALVTANIDNKGLYLDELIS